MMKKTTITHQAGDICMGLIGIETKGENKELSIAQIECDVRSLTEKKLGFSLSQDQWDWRAILRHMIAKISHSTTNFQTFKKFCRQYPGIAYRIHETCGRHTTTNGGSFNYLEYHIALGYHVGMILSGTNQIRNMNRKGIIDFLTEKTNNYFGQPPGRNLVMKTCVENMMPSIVSTTGKMLIAAGPTLPQSATLLLNMQRNCSEKSKSSTELLEYYNNCYSPTMWGILPSKIGEMA